MASLIDLFKGSPEEIENVSTGNGAVQDVKDFVAQEASGIRVKSLVEVNNPLIYGNEAIRILRRSTSTLDAMRDGQQPAGGGAGGDTGLIGGLVNKVTAAVNNFLGTNPIPSRIVIQLRQGKSLEDSIASTQGSGLGAFLKGTGGGNPSTMVKQAAGAGIAKAKDAARKFLFGSPGEAAVPSINGGPVFVGNPQLRPPQLPLWQVNDLYSLYLPQIYEELSGTDLDDHFVLQEQYLARTSAKIGIRKPIDLQEYSPIYGVNGNSPLSTTNLAFQSKFNNTFNTKIDGVSKYYNGEGSKYSETVDTNQLKAEVGDPGTLKSRYEIHFPQISSKVGEIPAIDLSTYSPIYGTQGGSTIADSVFGSQIKFNSTFNTETDGVAKYYNTEDKKYATFVKNDGLIDELGSAGALKSAYETHFPKVSSTLGEIPAIDLSTYSPIYGTEGGKPLDSSLFGSQIKFNSTFNTETDGVAKYYNSEDKKYSTFVKNDGLIDELGSGTALKSAYETHFPKVSSTLGEIPAVDLETHSPVYGTEAGKPLDSSDLGARIKTNSTFNTETDGVAKYYNSEDKKYSKIVENDGLTAELGSAGALKSAYETHFPKVSSTLGEIPAIDLETYSPIYGVKRGSTIDNSLLGTKTKANYTYNQNLDGLSKYSSKDENYYSKDPNLEGLSSIGADALSASSLKSKYEKKFPGVSSTMGNEDAVDLSKYSPIYGVDGVVSELGITTPAPKYDSTKIYTDTAKGKDGSSVKDNSLATKRGLGWAEGQKVGDFDRIAATKYASESTKTQEGYDLIPFWIGRYGRDNKIHLRATITGLTETVTPSWSTNKFFGNPYNFYTYDTIERSVSFTLMVYCTSEAELTNNWQKITELTRLTYPSITQTNWVNPPIVDFRLGDIYNKTIAFIESLSYTMPDDGTWEIDPNVGLLPKFIEVQLTLKFIEQPGSEKKPYSISLSPAAESELSKDDVVEKDTDGKSTEAAAQKKIIDSGNPANARNSEDLEAIINNGIKTQQPEIDWNALAEYQS